MLSRACLITVLVTLQAGCALGLGKATEGSRDAVRAAVPVLTTTPSQKSTKDLLRYMARITRLNTDEREHLFHMASATLEENSTLHNQLRLALVLSTPDPPPDENGRIRAALVKLLDHQDRLPDDIRTLAETRLYTLEQRGHLRKENLALRRQIEKLNTQLVQYTNDNGKEIKQLADALAEAEAKIEALTSIEEKIKRTGNTEPAPP